MNSDRPSFDPVWENLYSEGKHFNHYPYTSVVSVVSSYLSSINSSSPLRLLEVGCGAGNNLWFAAREGIETTGIDASKSAINYAKKRFENEGLSGNFHVGDFTNLPFDDNYFNFAIDRAAITSAGLSNGAKAVSEIHRTLKKGGRFYSELFSKKTTASGKKSVDGLILDIEGPYSGVGQICLYSEKQVMNIYRDGWKLLDMRHIEIIWDLSEKKQKVGQWNILAQKI